MKRLETDEGSCKDILKETHGEFINYIDLLNVRGCNKNQVFFLQKVFSKFA